MDCKDLSRHVHLFLDDALDVKTNLEVLAHLDMCEACCCSIESERRFRERLGQALCAPCCPEGLEDRVRAGLDSEALPSKAPSPLRRLLGTWYLRVAAVALILAAGLWLPIPRGDVPLSALAADVMDAHARIADGRLPLDVASSSREQVAEGLARLSQPVCLPAVPDCSLNGFATGRTRDGHDYVLVSFQGPKGALSHVDMPAKGVDLDESSTFRDSEGGIYYVFRSQGYCLVGVRAGDMICAYVCNEQAAGSDPIVEVLCQLLRR